MTSGAEIWARTEADVAERPSFTETTPVRFRDPGGSLLGLPELRALVPGPERDGSALPHAAGLARTAKEYVVRAVRWYTEPYQERTDAFHHQLIRVLDRLEQAGARADDERTALAAELRDLASEVSSLGRTLRGVNARIGALHAAGLTEPATAQQSIAFSADAFIDYVAFEDRHRGTRERVSGMLMPYVDWFVGCTSPVLDVGCGRGEFLELLRDAGIPSYGIDPDTNMIHACHEAGLDARLGDAIAHLEEVEPLSLGGVFSAQVAEHLTPPQLAALCRRSYEALGPGGVFAAETPNPETLYIFASFFYVDTSHTNPVHPEAFVFLLESAGFEDVAIHRSEAVPAPLRLEIPADALEIERRNVERLNDLLYGPQQYAVIARRRG